MSRFLLVGASVAIAIHGLIHMMGLVAYWPLGVLKEMPYKITLLDGCWEVGPAGMRIFAALWLVTAFGFVVAAAGLLMLQPWWRPLILGTIVLSTVLVALDWTSAFRGAIINAVILALVILASIVPRILKR